MVNFRALGVAIACASVAASASATQNVSKQRLDAIWDAMDTRVSSQMDVWFDDGDFPKAIHILNIEANYAPEDYDVVTNLGWMQENVEDWDGAIATYKLFLANNPHSSDRALPMADFLYRRKEYAKIPALLEPVISKTSHPNNYRILAHTYEKLKKFAEAVRVWKAYISVDPTDNMAKYNLKKMEQKAEAAKSSR